MGATSISPKHDMVLGLLTPLLGRMVNTEGFCVPRDIGNDSRVLVIDSGDLTEILFFAPVLKFLKQRYPGMRVTFLVREGNSELVRTMPQISEMITYEPAHLTLSSTTYLTLAKRVRHRDFNVAFLLGSEFNLARSVLTLATRAPIRIGFSGDRSFPFVNCEVRLSRETTYEATKVRSFLTVLGIHGLESLPGWALPDTDLRWARQLVHFHKPEKNTRLVAIDPGMGKGRHRLVDQSFAYLVNDLAARMQCKILLMSNNLDEKRIASFRSRLQGDLLGLEPKNVKEGLALLSCADLFLSGNTDFFHFAVDMRVPSVGLFTHHDSANWFPKGTPWVQILQGVKGQRVSLEEFNSKIDTLLHLTRVD
ncbi:MAG: glycosyltransferase family 9 protein [Candidatus Krumholzibacteriia bacterium]